MANRRPLQVPTGQATPDRVSRDVDAAMFDATKPGGPQLGAGGRLLRGAKDRGLVFTTGQTRVIRHPLGRKPAGWIVTRSYGESVALLVELASDKDTITLAHAASSGLGCTVDLWVF